MAYEIVTLGGQQQIEATAGEPFDVEAQVCCGSSECEEATLRVTLNKEIRGPFGVWFFPVVNAVQNTLKGSDETLAEHSFQTNSCVTEPVTTTVTIDEPGVYSIKGSIVNEVEHESQHVKVTE